MVEDRCTETKIAGFVVPPGHRAQTTYIVADGQCATPVLPEPCKSVSGGQGGLGGSGDELTFEGSLGGLERGPDAFRGQDDCVWLPPSGGDSCLWDTRTEDVTPFVAPGEESATVTVT